MEEERNVRSQNLVKSIWGLKSTVEGSKYPPPSGNWDETRKPVCGVWDQYENKTDGKSLHLIQFQERPSFLGRKVGRSEAKRWQNEMAGMCAHVAGFIEREPSASIYRPTHDSARSAIRGFHNSRIKMG